MAITPFMHALLERVADHPQQRTHCRATGVDPPADAVRAEAAPVGQCDVGRARRAGNAGRLGRPDRHERAQHVPVVLR
ncbi:hypothetical protein G6F59_016554 [Rhizopus arrhizus]|nr:hypothetical protein G6F59_016554 [Rhizopus arrhizus]